MASPAAAQDRSASNGNASAASPSPTAKGLWRTYPLHGGSGQRATPTASPVRTAAARPTATTQPTAATQPTVTPAAQRADGGSSWSVPLVVAIVIVGAAGAGVWTVVLLRRRGGRAQQTATPPEPAPERPRTRTGRFARSPGSEPPAAGGATRTVPPDGSPLSGVTPPDPTRPWTAEIGWGEERSGARFHVTASDRRGNEATIARSEVFDWPPQDAAAVQAMSGTADELQRELLAAGWASLPPGESWYAKRFAWTPVAAPPPVAPPAPPRPAPQSRPRAAPTRPAARTGAESRRATTAPSAPTTTPSARTTAPSARTTAPQPSSPTPAMPRTAASHAPRAVPRATPWPPDAESLWRCEIRWDAGYATSRFEAVAYPPGEGRGQPVARSEAFKWLLMALPDPKQPRQLAAARALARGLRNAGWEVAGRGNAWYAERYVWRRGGDPPAHLDIPTKEPA